uniref:RNA helicase n=1 Tax=Hippocampus comes TaxID=109280 RepID=A0A3Q2YXD4_HIPCM
IVFMFRHYRKRSTSPRRSGSRSRSRSADKRSKKDDRDRSRREGSRSRDRRRSRPQLYKKKKKQVWLHVFPQQQDFDQNKLEEEMRKRKERVEKWREEQRKKAIENIGEIKKELEEMKQGKKWSLEDDDGEKDSDPPGEKQDEDDEIDIDPLDAYMEEVKQEVKKFNMGGVKGNDKVGDGGDISLALVVIFVRKSKKANGSLQCVTQYSSEEEEVDLQTALTGFQTKQRKILEPVDHGKIQYEPYRKNFYVEVPDLARMSPEEVNTYRMELEGITVKGKGCPKPIKTWVQCGVSMKILNALKKSSYEKPTPIQAQAIPAIMSGRDLIGIAKTGSGKTIAFLLPMFRHIMDQRPLEEAEGPISVIMTPTRELALQITKECKKFSKSLGLRVVCVYGGTGISEQIAELKRGAEIIVCTPGRMIDMLGANSGECCHVLIADKYREFLFFFFFFFLINALGALLIRQTLNKNKQTNKKKKQVGAPWSALTARD